MVFTSRENWDMMCVFLENDMHGRNAAAAYAQKYPQREHPSRQHFRNLKRNLILHGRFSMPKDYLHRPRTRRVTDQAAREHIFGVVHANPTTSIRSISLDVNISKSSVHRVLQEADFHPFKQFLTQELRALDYEKRLVGIHQFDAPHEQLD